MCRFVCYLGAELLLEDLLYRPANSLILQSYKARERPEPLNGDGFGVGWYTPRLLETPCVFTSLTPAWSNQNLRRLAAHITSPCFFGHVRAASPEMRVGEENCHPFAAGRYLFMHNGTAAGFWRYKRRLCDALPDEVYNRLQGTTDSEHAFALFQTLLAADRDPNPMDLAEALVGTVRLLEEWRREAGVTEPSFLNFAVTDGHTVAATRYASDESRPAISLHVACGKKYVCEDGALRFVCAAPEECAAVIASERLTNDPDDWKTVPPNHVLTVSRETGIVMGPIGV